MVVRKPSVRESTDLQDDSVLDGDGKDVQTSVLDEEDSTADGEENAADEDDSLNEAGGEDTGEELDDINNDDLDSLLNESDDEDDEDDDEDEDEEDKAGGKEKDGEDDKKDDKDDKDGKNLDESNPIDNLGDKKAAPFTADDAKKAREKKEAEAGASDKGADEQKPAADKGADDLNEDFNDTAEVLEPTLYTDIDDPIVEEFGEMPDAIPDYPDEPIIELDTSDDFVADVDIETGITTPVYDVGTSFVLPESKNVVVAKGDRIYYCGKTQKNMPSFAESTFAKAAKMLAKSKNLKGSFLTEGKKSERVALIGRSCLVEIARDWRLPGTDTIFEKGDIIQIVSRKQVQEKEVKRK